MARTETPAGRVRALFIADLHLDASRPGSTELFLRFLRDEARQAPALFILGDLFEAWVGDDDDAQLPGEVANGLAALARSGTRIGFIRGNRDFLVGRDYAERAGFDILPDPCVVPLAGEPVLLLHGDLLCLADTGYQAVRRQVRQPAWQQALLARPLAERRAFAQSARASSMAHQQAMSTLETGDATPAAVNEMFRRYGVRRMIHGHTHRPAIHALEIDGQAHQRIVLGDWYEQSSVLRVREDGGLELVGLEPA